MRLLCALDILVERDELEHRAACRAEVGVAPAEHEGIVEREGWLGPLRARGVVSEAEAPIVAEVQGEGWTPEAEVAHELPVGIHRTLITPGHVHEVEGIAEAVEALLLDGSRHHRTLALHRRVEDAAEVVVQLDILRLEERGCREEEEAKEWARDEAKPSAVLGLAEARHHHAEEL